MLASESRRRLSWRETEIKMTAPSIAGVRCHGELGRRRYCGQMQKKKYILLRLKTPSSPTAADTKGTLSGNLHPGNRLVLYHNPGTVSQTKLIGIDPRGLILYATLLQ